MSNLFFRTNIAPYRIDTYNALSEQLECKLYFYWEEDYSQKMNMSALKSLCHFVPHILNGFEIKTGNKRRKICTEVWTIIKENSPSFIIVPEFQILTLQVLLYKLLHRSRFKVISMCDDSYDMVANNNDFSIIHKIARMIVTPLLDDLLLVDSRVVDWYKRRYHKGIWLPIIRDEKSEEKKYNRLLPLSNRLYNQYGLKGRKVVLYVGRLVALKNLEVLIRAFGKIKDDNAVLVIVGDGEEEKKLKDLCLKNNRVIFTGHLEGDNLYAWYNIGDVFCLPSYQEAFGAVINEALLAGCRVVVSEKAGSACIVNEHNGEIVNPFQMNEIVSAIERQLQKCLPRQEITIRPHLMGVGFGERIWYVGKKLMA